MTKATAVNIDEVYITPNDRVLDPQLLSKSLMERMPTPTGWRLLVLPYKGKGKTEGGVFLPDKVIDEHQVTTQVGYVLKMGPLAFQDKEKFP